MEIIEWNKIKVSEKGFRRKLLLLSQSDERDYMPVKNSAATINREILMIIKRTIKIKIFRRKIKSTSFLTPLWWWMFLAGRCTGPGISWSCGWQQCCSHAPRPLCRCGNRSGIKAEEGRIKGDHECLKWMFTGSLGFYVHNLYTLEW